MSNQSMEGKVKELLELKRMKEELEAEIAAQFTKQTTARRFSVN